MRPHTAARVALMSSMSADQYATAELVLTGVRRAHRDGWAARLPVEVLEWMVVAMAWCESNMDRNATAGAGELGVLQFIPGNIDRFRPTSSVGDWRGDPELSGYAGAMYIAGTATAEALTGWDGYLMGAEDSAVAGRWLWRYSNGQERVIARQVYGAGDPTHPTTPERRVFALGRSADAYARRVLYFLSGLASLALSGVWRAAPAAAGVVVSERYTNRLPHDN